jgi:hypothetical protein
MTKSAWWLPPSAKHTNRKGRSIEGYEPFKEPWFSKSSMARNVIVAHQEKTGAAQPPAKQDDGHVIGCRISLSDSLPAAARTISSMA